MGRREIMDVDAPVYPLDQRLFKEGGESRPQRRAALHAPNYCRIHQTLRVTPAMQAGITDHVWELEELVALLD
jgi:hypothetical protein